LKHFAAGRSFNPALCVRVWSPARQPVCHPTEDLSVGTQVW
jgi:hypothetical protein